MKRWKKGSSRDGQDMADAGPEETRGRTKSFTRTVIRSKVASDISSKQVILAAL